MTTSLSAPPTRLGRRTVVVAAGLTGVAISAPAALQALPGLFAAASAAPLDRASFEPHLGKAFTAAYDGGRADVELVELLDLTGEPGDTGSFAARFESRAELPQGTYELSRTGFAIRPVFLVPREPGTAGGLTATFNRTVGRTGR